MKMSKKNNVIQRALRKARRTRSAVLIGSAEAYDILCGDGYTSLDQNPEIVAACRKIAEVVGAMTIHVMENTERGDERVINELSRKIDINPCSTMTRQTFIEAIVMNLLLYGKGNSVVKVYTEDGYLSDMEPVAANRVSYQGDYTRYHVMIDGIPYAPDEVMHFVYNPDKVYLHGGQRRYSTIERCRGQPATGTGYNKCFHEEQVQAKPDRQSGWNDGRIFVAKGQTEADQ